MERELRERGKLTHAELAGATGLSRATISNIVGALRVEGRVRVGDAIHHGRRAKAVELAPEVGHAVGLDFGRRHITAVVAPFSREVVAEGEADLPGDVQWNDALEIGARLVERLMSRGRIDKSTLLGVGVGLPGPIDPSTGRVSALSIQPTWADAPVREALEERLGAAVVVENDANLGALGELGWGVSQEVRDLVYVKVGSGVGAGIVLDGRLFRGRHGTAGELGHLVVQPEGRVCRCGNRGCLETVVSADAIAGLLSPTHGDGLSAGDVIAGAEAGDRASRQALQHAGAVLGRAVSHLCTLFDISTVIVGGELAGAGELLIESMRGAITHTVLPGPSTVVVVASRLGRRATALGGAAQVMAQPAADRPGAGP